MKTATFVTGNAGKLRELRALTPAGFDITSRELDLVEIQSLDPYEIVKDKLQRAYEIVQAPVIVEDVSTGLDALGGLPGPFFKFFEKTLGRGALYQLTKKPDEKVTIRCVAGYYDGSQMLFGEGVLHGTVVAPRGSGGFGFDPTVVPEGETRTLAEMTTEEKNAISHRAKAFKALIEELKQL